MSEFPKKVSYNKADVQRMVDTKPVANDKWVKLVIGQVKPLTAPTKGKGPGEDLILQCRCDILDPKNGQARLARAPSIFMRMTLPVRHPDYENTHVPPDWAPGLWAQFCRAFIGERHPEKPRTVEGKLKFKGKNVEREDLPAIQDELNEGLLKEATARAADGGLDLLRRVAYCQTKISEEGYLNSRNLVAVLPNGAKLATAEELFTAEAPAQEKKKEK